MRKLLIVVAIAAAFGAGSASAQPASWIREFTDGGGYWCSAAAYGSQYADLVCEAPLRGQANYRCDLIRSASLPNVIEASCRYGDDRIRTYAIPTDW